ncbi:MAG: AMP-binding protein [Candidatus Polarisedimenticolia bacterium]|nr:AMP-binding protein [bacterium]
MTLSFLDAARETPRALAFVGPAEAITCASFAERIRLEMERLDERMRQEMERLDERATPRAALSPRPTIDSLARLGALVEMRRPTALLHPRLSAAERRARLELAAPIFDADEGRLVPPRGDAQRRADEPLGVIDVARRGLDVARGGLDVARGGAATDDGGDEWPLAIVFTSGTTGAPKGIVLPRRSFLASAAMSAERFGWRDDDRWLLCLPLAHVGGLSVVTRSLLARKPVVLARSSAPRDIAAALDDGRATLASFVPAQLARLFRELPEWRAPRALRMALVGGAGASPALVAEAERRGVPVFTSYGLTETCSQVATRLPGDPPDRLAPLPGVRLRIVGGRIEIASPSLAAGFFPADPAAPEFAPGGWLRTRDRGRLDERGRLTTLGRADDVIVTGGENVDPLVVERALEEAPEIAAALVFPLPDPVFGQIVAAALVPRVADAAEATHADAGEAAVAAAERAAAALAPHERPRAFAVAAELPHNAVGKLDRRAAARLFAADARRA